MTKLCKDCKHAKRSWFPMLFRPMYFATCLAAPKITLEDDMLLVDGKTESTLEFYDCSTERKSCGDCGPSGKNFEPKK